ncbi:MAG: hypothetical protein KAR42_16900 [candidate division Zixibacteria bacterium]|nr:hypothetical protein [candidate division Zixibacteria bacterium]
MFYVLFTYVKGQIGRDFQKFRSEKELIDFLHENYEKIEIVQILEVEKTYRLGLIETEDLIKSALISQEIETDLPDPEEIDLSRETNVSAGPSAGKSLTDEEKNEAAIKRSDEAIEAAKKDLEKEKKPVKKPPKKPAKKERQIDKSKWRDCPDCGKEKAMSPWNKSGRCSKCQQYKKIPN